MMGVIYDNQIGSPAYHPESQNYRITEYLELEGTNKDH